MLGNRRNCDRTHMSPTSQPVNSRALPQSIGGATLVFILSLLTVACADYTWKLNEQVVYGPPGLFRDFQVADPALQVCLDQAIADTGAQDARALDTLICSDAGIQRLDGIETFSGLRRVNLDSNRIVDASALALLPRLELLHLRDNQLSGLAPLICAQSLDRIALAGNNGIDCADVRYLRDCGITVIDQPATCE